MEAYIRLGLLLVAAVIVLLMIGDALRRHKRAKITLSSPLRDSLDLQDLSLRGCEALSRGNPVRSGSPRLSASQPRDDDTSLDHHFSERDPFSISEPCVRLSPSIVEVETPSTPVKPAVTPPADDLITISVMAKPGNAFVAYDLLQAILATGMQFGEMNIFHYYSTAETGKKTLFSLASATKPGSFDLDRMGEFTCTGLTLFSQLSLVPHPQQAFDLLLKTAERLAEDLEGDLYASQQTPWSEAILQKYQEKVLYFQASR